MSNHTYIRQITRFQDADDVQAPASGATDTGKAWLWNNATAKFEPVDVLTAAEAAAAYLPLSGGTLTGQLTMADGIRIDTDKVQARDSSGLTLTEDGGSGILIQDSTAAVLVNTTTALTGVLGAAQAQIDKTSNGTMLLHRASTDEGGVTIELLKRRTNWGVVSNGDRLGTIQWSAADGVDAAAAASIYAEVDGTPGSNDMPGRIVFATTPDGAAAADEAMRINSSGNLLIATGKRIETDEVRAKGASGLSLNEDGGVGGMRILDGGAVTVNASTSVSGFAGAAQMQVANTTTAGLMLYRATADANGPVLELLKQRSSFGVASSGDRAGTIQWSAADGTDAAPVASIYAEVDGTPGSNDMPGRIVFATTADGANAVTEAFRVNSSQNIIIADSKRIETDEVRARDSGGLKLYDDGGTGLFVADGGNIGIGTSTPTLGLLQIQGNLGGGGTAGLYFNPTAAGSGTQYGIRVVGNGAGASDFIGFGIHGGTLTNWVSSLWIGDEANRPGINVGYAYNTTAPTHGMIIFGQVGIGDASPDGKLDVHQGSTTAAIPTLELEQADLSEEFINFISTVGAGNPIDTAALGSYYGKIRVQVDGVGYKYMPLYNS
ncbi:MAG: hypothetical protein E6Q97_15990 [Desulfurellales bacterium]|nr:MAG: hypothetical protein E6Q97_15990 [Desulfurellales bacterium]